VTPEQARLPRPNLRNNNNNNLNRLIPQVTHGLVLLTRWTMPLNRIFALPGFPKKSGTLKQDGLYPFLKLVTQVDQQSFAVSAWA
jgi:hypothetical protein